MTIVRRTSQPQIKKSLPGKLLDFWFKNLLIARLIAIIAIINFGVVLFDLSYLALRDFWLQGTVTIGNFKIGPIEREGTKLKVLPDVANEFITQYDVIKGVVPDRDTAAYLQTVEQLKNSLCGSESASLEEQKLPEGNIKKPPAQTISCSQDIINKNLETPEVEKLLEELRNRSVDMIDTNPFELANKTGTLEKIKNKMREREKLENQEDSSKQAFREFWSSEYLKKQQPIEEITFFDEEIRPLIETNYYRPIGENGDFVDYFGLIDFPFFVVIFVDFLGRSLYISRQHTGVSWLDGMLWRWYDLLFFLPIFRWIRIVPLTVRLNQTHLIDLKKIQKQASQGFVAGIAGDVTEVVVLQIINQIQALVEEGEIRKMLSSSASQQYIDLNNTNETVEITLLVAKTLIYEVLPKIKPDVEEFLKYNIEKAVKSNPAYQGISHFPGVERLQTNISNELAIRIYQVLLDTLNSLLEKDPVFDELIEKIAMNFSKTMTSEIQTKQSIDRLESLLTDLLEEIKVNYVQRLSVEDVEKILEETRALKTVTQSQTLN